MTRLTRAERMDDARKSYDEAIRALREKQIRAHAIQPRKDNPEELRWAEEGPTKRAREEPA